MTHVTDGEFKPSLESTLASELTDFIEGIAVGAEFVIPRSAPICYTLELFLPELLRRRHVEWSRESLDGFFFASAKKIGPNAAELVGTCILINDQTVTPFRASFVVTANGDSIAAHRVRLGEQGNGSLGISGPPCNSKAASRLLEGLMSRIDSVRWSYDVNSMQLAGNSTRG